MNATIPRVPISDRWDVVVIGAGPAGSVSAIELARRGLTVLLVDAARFPRFKVCGGCLAPAGAEAVRGLGAAAVVDGPGTAALRSCELRARGVSVRTSLSGTRVVDRARFDASIIELAQQSGVRFEDSSAASVLSARSVHDGLVPVSIGRQGRTSEVGARAVVVADGLSSPSTSTLGEFAARISRHSRMGVGLVASLDVGAPALGEVRMLVEPGQYVGIVRLADGRCDIAASVSPLKLRAAGGPASLMAEVLDRHGMRMNACDARWLGTPLLTRRRNPAIAGVFLVGDAAGYGEPLTGQGISWAVQGARLAAGRVEEAVRRGGPAGVQEWRAEHAALTGPGHRRAVFLSAMARMPRLVACGITVAAGFPWLAQQLALLTGHLDSGDIGG